MKMLMAIPASSDLKCIMVSAQNHGFWGGRWPAEHDAAHGDGHSCTLTAVKVARIAAKRKSFMMILWVLVVCVEASEARRVSTHAQAGGGECGARPKG